MPKLPPDGRGGLCFVKWDVLDVQSCMGNRRRFARMTKSKKSSLAPYRKIMKEPPIRDLGSLLVLGLSSPVLHGECKKGEQCTCGAI